MLLSHSFDEVQVIGTQAWKVISFKFLDPGFQCGKIPIIGFTQRRAGSDSFLFWFYNPQTVAWDSIPHPPKRELNFTGILVFRFRIRNGSITGLDLYVAQGNEGLRLNSTLNLAVILTSTLCLGELRWSCWYAFHLIRLSVTGLGRGEAKASAFTSRHCNKMNLSLSPGYSVLQRKQGNFTRQFKEWAAFYRNTWFDNLP